MSTMPLAPSDEAAFAAARSIIDAAAISDGGPPISDQSLIGAARGLRALIGVTEHPGGPLRGIGMLGGGELDLVVHPEFRGRGLGGAAFRALLAPATRAQATANSPAANSPMPASTRLSAWVHGEQPAATHLLTAAGFAPKRTLLRLTLDPTLLPAAIADARALPAGTHERAFDPASPADAEAWVRVNARAFATHPEQGRLGLDDFAALRDEPWFDPHDLRLAIDAGGTVVGFTWVKVTRDPDAGVETELYVLGVDPDFAGSGLGAGLLGVTLARMAIHHPGRISLYVDGDNDRALALYLRAGFTTDRVSTQWIEPEPVEANVAG